ncbi:LysM peptidoglycan-binding domain-containing protein [Liquorilactobacillus cacaonum]|uniref:Peptidoglycan-binding protein n=1 Tax=Liquorilactobacillus cacaonum DSM 21116 TaxID=1423729 RepID=A0A0R2CPK4_9LACO|nr:LysM peptidoglycan-binding domain-containing protein [Liquorilactobacillus cacaonum]KRM90188.1 peptidoglycan-binding protein [Liquorilactobacillus cacaonum DSM 21116]
MDIKKILLSAATVTGMLTAGTVAANADSVTVKAGDTVSELANEYNTTVDSIVQQNSLQNKNLIIVGQKLEIGGTTSSNSVATTATQSLATTPVTTSKAPTTPAASTTSAVPAKTTTATTYTAASSSSAEVTARNWIAARESGGSYTARNGQYYGKYQLSASYLNGDYSAANQERVANNYVINRYGSWQNAVKHWQANGWY